MVTQSIYRKTPCHHEQDHNGHVIKEEECPRLTIIKESKHCASQHIPREATLYKCCASVDRYTRGDRTYCRKYLFILHVQLSERSRQMCSGMNAQQHITPVCQHHMNSSCLCRNRKCGKECIQMLAHQYSAYRLKKHKDKKEHTCLFVFPAFLTIWRCSQCPNSFPKN